MNAILNQTPAMIFYQYSRGRPDRKGYRNLLSQRRRGRKELHCLFCSYMKDLCVLCALARNFMFFFRKGDKVAKNFNVY